MSESGYIIRELRKPLEDALLEAEARIREEKYWLERIYEGLGATLGTDAPEVEIVTAYTLGFLTDRLPELSNKIKSE